MRATESDPRVTELYNESTPFLDAYPDYDLALLPTWVRENIEAARVYGGSKRGVVLPDGRKYHLDNKLNDLTGREWTFFINSVFSTHYPTRGEEAYAHHIRKIHPTPKPPQLMRDLIRFFSKEGELIFDFFMGVGGTLLGAGLCNRVAAGIDLKQEYSATKASVNAYAMALANELRPFGITVCAVMPGDIHTGFTAARRKVSEGDDIYGGRISRSVARMEHDEQTGMDPAKAGAYIAKVALRERSHHPLYAIRADYKFFVFLSKILPAQALNRLIYAIYAK